MSNVYEKLALMRVELQKLKIKKSGRNRFSNYGYYELSDILPPINELQSKYKTCSLVTFSKTEAILTIINSENPDEKISFVSPMADLDLKGSNPIQNIGAIETYQRRYLYMTAFEIVENDYFDSLDNRNKQNNIANYKKQYMQLCREKGIDATEYAKKNNITKDTTEAEYQKICRVLAGN